MRLSSPVEFSGRGLHTGELGRVRVEPGRTGAGVVVDTGDGDAPLWTLTPDGSRRATALLDAHGRLVVRGVEHLLAALAGLSMWDVRLSFEGGEVPALDGSALPFARDLASRGVEGAPPPRVGVSERIELRSGRSTLCLSPADELVLDVGIDFDDPHVGRQRRVFRPADSFLDELAPARTFGFTRELASLRGRSLARGGSLECAQVFGPEGPLTEARFTDEPVRHKTLDLLGDLALLGRPLRGRLRAERPSHALSHRLVNALRHRLVMRGEPTLSCNF
jgi:UDP-3-O-[3-hydroxymyristoyl] N-acetylglucosamine deacetylase